MSPTNRTIKRAVFFSCLGGLACTPVDLTGPSGDGKRFDVVLGQVAPATEGVLLELTSTDSIVDLAAAGAYVLSSVPLAANTVLVLVRGELQVGPVLSGVASGTGPTLSVRVLDAARGKNQGYAPVSPTEVVATLTLR